MALAPCFGFGFGFGCQIPKRVSVSQTILRTRSKYEVHVWRLPLLYVTLNDRQTVN